MIVTLAALLVAAHAWIGAATAASVQDFVATLPAQQQDEFVAWRTAKSQHDRLLDAYWKQIETKRAGRRAKRAKTKFFDGDDYVWTFPPTYKGPKLSAELDRKWTRFLASQERKEPSKPPTPIPGLDDYLAAAKQHYGFQPTRISEREFKRRYAHEALTLGLSPEQVVRVYALETGGDGTADMQAGINPITKKGKPISSALGYAQLLHANTIGELVKHGDGFIKRLQRLQANAKDPGRAAELRRKIASLQAMMRSAKSVPNNWYRHVAFAKTTKGYGMHAINLDGDLGPWLQSLKLRGLKDFAARKGVTNLSGEEIELMNLSGPGTGLEMMQPTGLTAPTPNFFSRRAYYVNKMVIDKTTAELLAEFTRRMDRSVRKPGAVEFAEAFEEVSPRSQNAVQPAKLPWR
ncbi:MAG: hypothetical protein WC829_07430 [Hyphomicrobium sp.]|jgi:hypothetical protein